MFSVKRTLFIAIAVVAILMAGLVINGNETAGDVQRNAVLSGRKPSDRGINIQAPDFTLKTVEGEAVRLEDFRGKVVLINIWATWCQPCRVEIPDLVKLKAKHGNEGFDILAITVQSGSPRRIREFAEYFNMNYWVLTSNDDRDISRVLDLYGSAIGVRLNAIPTTFLIDRTGFIRQWYLGPRTEEHLWEDIKKYL